MVKLSTLITTLAFSANAEYMETYKSYRVGSALHYFKHWHKDNLYHKTSNSIERKGTEIGLMSFANDDEAPTLERAHLLMGAHRAGNCAQSPEISNMDLLQSHKDQDGMHHMVLMADHGLQYLVTKGNERMIMADPPVCEALIEGKPKGKADFKKAKTPSGGKKELLTADDPLVQDCLALFHRTAMENCNEDYEVTLIDAALSVIDGLRVMTHVTMVGPAGRETKHRPSCLFEVSTDHTDASFLQRLQRQPGAAEEEDPLPEEEAGLEATLELHVPLCDADEEDGVPETEAESFMFMMQHGMGELSKYKGYEYVRSLVPLVTAASFLGVADDEVDLRSRFAQCFPDAGAEVVRNQAQCGSCWSFAAATTTMNQLCTSGMGSASSLASAGDRYEVAVSQIMACNTEQRGCNGGHAPGASTALIQGISKERDAPYACGQGDPQNHFEQASQSCSGPPWGANCDASTAFSQWHFLGASALDGETDMKSFISAGHTLYCTLQVYDDFMHLEAGSIFTGGGSLRGGHALACVGYGSQGGQQYWILQNSWGPSWADGGYGKIARGGNLAEIEEGAYYFRASEDGGDVPPCYDGADTGLNAGSGNIPCDQAAGPRPYGNLCEHPNYGAGVSANCPLSCGACLGGDGDAAAWGAGGGAASPSPGPSPAPAPVNCPAGCSPSLLQTKASTSQSIIDHIGTIKSQTELIEILNAVGDRLRTRAESGDL